MSGYASSSLPAFSCRPWVRGVLTGLLVLTPVCFPPCVEADPISFEVGLGVTSLPALELTHQLRLGYQLPLNSDGQLELVLGATTPPLFWGLDQLFLAGRYHFGAPQGWQPYLLAGAGIMPLRRNEFGLQLGAGLSQWWSEGFGLSWNASLSLPPANPQLMTLNADLSLKWRWDPFEPDSPPTEPAAEDVSSGLRPHPEFEAII